jgi:hypothetical protein
MLYLNDHLRGSIESPLARKSANIPPRGIAITDKYIVALMNSL